MSSMILVTQEFETDYQAYDILIQKKYCSIYFSLT